MKKCIKVEKEIERVTESRERWRDRDRCKYIEENILVERYQMREKYLEIERREIDKDREIEG